MKKKKGLETMFQMWPQTLVINSHQYEFGYLNLIMCLIKCLEVEKVTGIHTFVHVYVSAYK